MSWYNLPFVIAWITELVSSFWLKVLQASHLISQVRSWARLCLIHAVFLKCSLSFVVFQHQYSCIRKKGVAFRQTNSTWVIVLSLLALFQPYNLKCIFRFLEWHLDTGCPYQGQAVLHPFAVRVHAHKLGMEILLLLFLLANISLDSRLWYGE